MQSPTPYSLRSRLIMSLSFLLLVGLTFPALFLHGWVPLNGDALRFVYPNWTFIHSALHRLHLPLWNPYRSMGEPFLADPRSMVTSPILWLTASADDFNVFLQLWIVIHTGL